jgi:hypothetical protein
MSESVRVTSKNMERRKLGLLTLSACNMSLSKIITSWVLIQVMV